MEQTAATAPSSRELRRGPRPHDEAPGRGAGLAPLPAVEALTGLVLRRRMRAALDLLEARIAAGIGIEGILRDYLAPAARRLGALWDQDRVNFTEVTVGVGRLQDLQRELDAHLRPVALPVEAPRALLATTPGEQHSFGVSMTAALLHQRGWEVTGAPSNHGEDLLAVARTGWYDVIGLSLACERHLATTAPLVARLRDASLNGNVRIVVGGALPAAFPELAGELGADDAVTDASALQLQQD